MTIILNIYFIKIYLNELIFLQCLQGVQSLHYLVYQVIHFWNIVINNGVKIDHVKDVEHHGTFQQDLLRGLVSNLCLFLCKLSPP